MLESNKEEEETTGDLLMWRQQQRGEAPEMFVKRLINWATTLDVLK